MIHMTIQQLSSYLDAELATDSMERVGIHLSSCEECTHKFTSIEQQANLLTSVLRRDPGDVLSERFEREVDERIASGKRMVAPRPTAIRTLPPLPDIPRATLEPVREDPAPRTNGVQRAAKTVVGSIAGLTRPRRREDDPPRWPAAWAVVAILAVIVSATGVVASRTGLLHSLGDLRELGGLFDLPSVEGLHRVPEPVVASTDSTAVTESVPAAWVAESGTSADVQAASASQDAPAALVQEAPQQTSHDRRSNASDTAAQEEEDEFSVPESPPTEPPPVQQAAPGAGTSTLRGDELLPSGSTPSRPSTPVEAARMMSERAASDPSASSYEAAARSWEAALGTLHGDAYQDGRWRIAEARFRAWQMDSEEGSRASRANAAIRAFLIAAPPGEAREQARQWLTTIRDSGFR